MKRSLAFLLLLAPLVLSNAGSACPMYDSYEDCLQNCNFQDDPCAAYIGSCQYLCDSMDFDNPTPSECLDCDCWQCPSGCECVFIGGPGCYVVDSQGIIVSDCESTQPTMPPPPTPEACTNSCGPAQTQQPYPDCFCLDIPPCPQRQLSDLSEPKLGGKLQKVTGTLLVLTDGGWCSVPPGSENIVVKTDQVKVLNGTAQIVYYNGARVDLAPGARIEVVGPVTSPDGSVKDILFRMGEGAYHYVFPTDAYGPFEVQMDSVCPGIKGTEFVVEKQADNSMVFYLIEGHLEPYAASNPSSKQSLSAGQKIFFDSQGNPGTPSAYSSSELQAWWPVEGDAVTACPTALLLLCLLLPGVVISK